MKTFPINFRIGTIELDAIVTYSENSERFKVEMVTGEPNPMILKRDGSGSWHIENSGGRRLSETCFQDIQSAIETRLKEV